MNLLTQLSQIRSALILLLVCSSLLGQDQVGFNYLQSNSVLISGTGKTNGHVINVVINNTENQSKELQLPPIFIPSNGSYQGYLIPDSTSVTIPANGSQLLKLNGYCTNINLPAVPKAVEISNVDQWVVANVEEAPAVFGWTAPYGYTVNEASNNNNLPVTLNYIGTEKKFIYALDIDRYSKDAASLLLHSFNAIKKQALKNIENGALSTPYANNSQQELETIVQHTFWIYCGTLQEQPYEKDLFRDHAQQQFGIAFPEPSPEKTSEFHQGVNQFWNAFVITGEEAKVFSANTSIQTN